MRHASALFVLIAGTASAQAITTNTTWSGTVTVDRDVVVNPGVTLTVAAGTTVNIATSDAANLGTNSSRVELIVHGTLNVNGTAATPVLFGTTGSTAGSWSGIRIEAAGTASISSATIEEASVAVESNGNATITGGTLRNSSQGVRSNAGTATISGSLLSTNTYGAYATGGALTVDHCTVVNGTYGVYSVGGSGSVNVQASIVSGNQYGLYRVSGSVSINNSNNDVWNNGSGDYSLVPAGANSISSNPLFVGGAGATPYRLTSNSPARKSDAVGADLGAFPYVSDPTPTLTGTLWANTTLATSQAITGDLIVAPGVTVTIAPGVVLTATASDLMQSSDTSRVELIVRGTLNVSSAGSPSTLSASGASAGSWTGVRVEGGGTLTAAGLIVERAQAAIDVVSTGTAMVSGGILRNSSQGVRANGGNVTVTSMLLSGNTYGAYATAGALSLDHCTIVNGTYGVYSVGGSGSVGVTSSIITGNQYGLYRVSGSVSISNSYNDVWNNGSGDYSLVPQGTNSISSNPLYVGGAGATPYRLTSNSPARNSDPIGGDLGAFAYVSDPTPTLTGTLWANTTINTSQALTGDLIVPAGVTVTLAPGVVLTASASDLMQSSDTSRVELIVRGTFSVNSSGNASTLTATGASAGAWTGVRVESGGTLAATGLVVERAQAAVDVTGTGTATISGSIFRNSSQGVRASGGNTTVGLTQLSANTYGAYASGGALSLDHCTIVNGTYGVYSVGGSGSVGVTSSIITGNQYGLYRVSGSVSISNSYDDVWNNGSGDYSLVPAGVGNITSNPLYVGTGATPFRLTSNSPARNSDALGNDMGAFPYGGDSTPTLTGTLWANTTVSASQTITGDLIVGQGVTLTLAPGVTLTASTSDAQQSGDTSRVELIVRGRLTVSAAGNPVTLTSSGASAGSWTGVRVEPGGTLDAAGLIVERAQVGVEVTGGTATVTNSIFRNSSQGARSSSGTASFSTSLFSGNTYGAYATGGALSLDHVTIVNGTYGVYSVGGSGSVGITGSIVTGNQYGLYRVSGSVTISNSYNDVWSNGSGDYSLVSAGVGSISSNPLYVGSGATPFRITSNSPARRSDLMGGDMGAFPYVSDPTAGLTGTLWADTTISGAQSLTGDLTVGPGVTVTLAPGAVLTASASDQMQSGNDLSRVELIVRGTLSVNAVGMPVTLTATGASAGAWSGVRVETGGSAQLSGLTISRAVSGVEMLGNMNLTDCTLSTNQSGVRVGSGSTTIARCLFTSNTYGAYATGGSLSIDHSTIVQGTYGVYSVGGSGSVAITSSVLTGNQYGLYRVSGAVTINNSYNDVWSNGSGDYSLVSGGTGSFSANPLYVGSGTTPYRLTSNSPARRSDPMGGDLGAFPYTSDPTVGLVGVLWTDTTLSASASVPGDLTVGPNVTVTVAPGVVLTAATSDQMQAGNDLSRVELIVRGTLQISGTAASPVTLTSTGAGSSSWTGVRVLAGGSAVITSAVFTRGQACLETFGPATVTNSRFTGCQSGVRTNQGTQTVNSSVFDANTYGVYAAGGSITLDHLTMFGNTYGVYSVGGTGAVGVTNSIFQQHNNGLYRVSGAVTITNSYNLAFNSPPSLVTTGSNSLTSDPLLVSPGTADFRLQAASPARGAGTSMSDLGAFPFAPGAVDRVTVSPASPSVAAGGTVTFTAAAFDAANNPVPAATFTWSALPSAGSITQAGVLTAGCSVGMVTNGVTVTSNGRSASATVNVIAGPLASITVGPSNPTVRAQQTQQLTATGLDICNNTVPTPSLAWSVPAAAGVISAGGLYTAGCAPGAYPMAITATSGSITGRGSVTVAVGPLATVSVSPTSASVAVNGTRQFTGSTADGCGNPLSLGIGWSTSVTGGMIDMSGLFTAGTTPGTFASGVTATATEGAVTRTASAGVTVTGGSVATVSVTPSMATVGTGGTVSFSAVARDAFGNVVAGTPAWSVVAMGGTINGAGLFTAGNVAGTYTNTVRATIGGVDGTATVVVQPGPVTRVAVAPSSATLAPMGTTTFTAQAFDANNNVVGAAVMWSATAAAGTITQGGAFTAGTMSGNYPAAVTATVGAVSGTASVTINAGALAQLTVVPAVASTTAGGTVAFTASGRDGNGNTVAVTPTWSVVADGGTISSSGLFTAGTTTGTFVNTVRAESSGVTAFATVSVTAGPLVRLELTPASVELLEGATQQFTVAGSDAFNNPVAVTPTWSAQSAAGTITASGLFTAGMLPGDYASGVTATQGAVVGNARVVVRSSMPDAGVDAGVVDAGTEPPDSGTPDAGGEMMMADGGGMMMATSGCGCGQADASLLGVLGALAMLLRRRRGSR